MLITVWEMNGIMNAGGTESLIMEMLRQRGEKIDYRLIVHYPDKPESGIYDKEINRLGVQIEYLPSVGSVGYKRYERSLKELIERVGKPDVVHIHMNAVGGLIAKACRKSGINCRIVHCHADIRYRGSLRQKIVSECKLSIMKMYVRIYATSFWACSKEAAMRLFGKRDAVIIPNCINVERYSCSIITKRERREKYGFDNEMFIIGAIGRVARIKSYETIIQTLPLIHSKNPNAHFVCFGRIDDAKYYNSLLELAENLHVLNHVHFMGNSTEVNLDIQMFDCFAMPSISEGFGIAALEAQAAGLRVIISTGVPQNVDIGLGLVSRQAVGDVNGWVQALTENKQYFRDDRSILRAFEQKGYSSACEVRKIEKMYLEMVGKKA